LSLPANKSAMNSVRIADVAPQDEVSGLAAVDAYVLRKHQERQQVAHPARLKRVEEVNGVAG
jgi:hypothetical protein